MKKQPDQNHDNEVLKSENTELKHQIKGLLKSVDEYKKLLDDTKKLLDIEQGNSNLNHRENNSRYVVQFHFSNTDERPILRLYYPYTPVFHRPGDYVNLEVDKKDKHVEPFIVNRVETSYQSYATVGKENVFHHLITYYVERAPMNMPMAVFLRENNDEDLYTDTSNRMAA